MILSRNVFFSTIVISSLVLGSCEKPSVFFMEKNDTTLVKEKVTYIKSTLTNTAISDKSNTNTATIKIPIKFPDYIVKETIERQKSGKSFSTKTMSYFSYVRIVLLDQTTNIKSENTVYTSGSSQTTVFTGQPVGHSFKLYVEARVDSYTTIGAGVSDYFTSTSGENTRYLTIKIPSSTSGGVSGGANVNASISFQEG